jgi:hypothetical protein
MRGEREAAGEFLKREFAVGVRALRLRHLALTFQVRSARSGVSVECLYFGAGVSGTTTGSGDGRASSPFTSCPARPLIAM